MKFRLQMLQPNPLIARSPALQFKGALAQTRTKHGSQHLLHSEITHVKKGKLKASAVLLGAQSRAGSPRVSPAPRQSSRARRSLCQGSPRLPREERATCSSNPRNHSPALRQENTRGKAVLAMGRGTAGIWGTSVHPDSSLLPQPAR